MKEKPVWEYEFTEDCFEQARQSMRPYADLYWFAKDRDGDFGVFYSAGFGPIPRFAIASFDAHRRASMALLHGHPASYFENVLAKKGLYIFDWEGHGQYVPNHPYFRKVTPSLEKEQLDTAAREALERCAVKLDVLFRDSQTVVLEMLHLDLNTP